MKWPLAVSNFTVLDKLKIGAWLLKENHWSAGEWVRRYEQQWEDYTGAPYAIMVSSGSAANLLIAQRRKHELMQGGEWPQKNKVVFPVVNWISAVSPWIQLGFQPVFMDVSSNMCSSGDQVSIALLDKDVGAVFYTTLLGLSGDLDRIQKICDHRSVPLYLDNCESSFSLWDERHFCNFGTSSTSFYFSHHTSGNQEGGMVFCQTAEEACWYRMARNHGMTRGMPDAYKNPEAHPHFDFYLMGSNHRSSNLIAYMASLDFRRALDFCWKRRALSAKFTHELDDKNYENPHMLLGNSVPLVLPIVCRKDGGIVKVKKLLNKLGIEHRPIVGGNLLRHTAFRGYGKAKQFKRANHIHDEGLYIGLHSKVTARMVQDLANQLNDL